jgi:hypothetical protein
LLATATMAIARDRDDHDWPIRGNAVPEDAEGV